MEKRLGNRVFVLVVVAFYVGIVVYLTLTLVPPDRSWLMIASGWIALGISTFIGGIYTPQRTGPMDVNQLFTAVFYPLTGVRGMTGRVQGTGRSAATANVPRLTPRSQQLLWLLGVAGIVVGTDFLRWFPPYMEMIALLAFLFLTIQYRGALAALSLSGKSASGQRENGE